MDGYSQKKNENEKKNASLTHYCKFTNYNRPGS